MRSAKPASYGRPVLVAVLYVCVLVSKLQVKRNIVTVSFTSLPSAFVAPSVQSHATLPAERHPWSASFVSGKQHGFYPNRNPGMQYQNEGKIRRRASSLVVGTLFSIAAVATVLVNRSFIIIKQGSAALVENLGRFDRQLEPGFHVIKPFFESIRARLTIREQVLDIPPQACITSDNAPLKADAVVYWRIFDPPKAVYAVNSLIDAIQNLVLTQLRSEIGKLTLDETFTARQRLNSVLLKELDEATDPWGVKVTRVEVRDIIPNKEILSSMEMQMAAERTKRAQIIESEGAKQALLNSAAGKAEASILEANAKKRAQILQAEGEKERLLREAEGLALALVEVTKAAGGDPEQAVRLQMLKAYIDSQLALASSSNTKVLLFPSSEDLNAKAGAVLAEMQASAVGSELQNQKAKGK